MIRGLHHIAIIGFSNECISFYERLGFVIDARRLRPDCGDEIIWMKGFDVYLELFLFKKHPKRIVDPEAYGLSHLAFFVDNLDKMLEIMSQYKCDPIKIGHSGMRTCFIYDPAGTPIELKEIIR